MKFNTPNPLVLLLFICSISFFASCSKDSDLFNEDVLSNPETDPIENVDSDATDESGEEEGDGIANRVGDDDNILIDTAFDNIGLWDLENGSTIENGVMTLFANNETNVTYSNILTEAYYQTRRYRFTFRARQTSGSGELQFRQSNGVSFEQALTPDWNTYVIEDNGNIANSENDINFRGRINGDVFEIDNFKMEIIGDTTDPNVPGRPSQVSFYTDFEFDTYGYNQWGNNGVREDEINQWEIDHGAPRTTEHPEAHITAGRDGTGEAIWLGTYNNNQQRNEMTKDIALPFNEFWVGWSFNVQNRLADDRIMMQARNLAPGGSSTVNAISMRQHDDDDKIYFSFPTDVNFVDQTRESLGTWNGAGTNTEQVIVNNYNYQAWNDVVIHYKAGFGANYTGPDTSSLVEAFGRDPRSDGIIELWVNGVKIFEHVGTTIYRYERRGGQIRFGLSATLGAYWGGSETFAFGGDVYYDNYSIWTGPNGTYEDIDPSR